jgi:hypothetical protein
MQGPECRPSIAKQNKTKNKQQQKNNSDWGPSKENSNNYKNFQWDTAWQSSD